MFLKRIVLLILFLSISLSSFSQKKINTFLYGGRVDKMQNGNVVLIGTASSISFNFTGNQCFISLQSIDNWEHHNYVVLELDGKYIGKVRVDKGAPQSFPVIAASSIMNTHNLTIYKATEAIMGNIVFLGTTAKLASISPKRKKKIEFIGDSITCGAANDLSEFPCNEGEYFDHHNGYFAFGPILSRGIGADYLLSSVSGIGMYRNWDDESEELAVMPSVYENLYLVKSSLMPKYDFAFQPDIISISLGTNDLADGDGKKERLPFDSQKYILSYINFIKMLYKHNENVQIVLTNSPLLKGEKAIVLEDCLIKVIEAFVSDKMHKPILIFNFKQVMNPKGCSGHLNVTENKIIADEYTSFIKEVLNEK